MRNVVEAHSRVKDFDWEFSYAPKPARYPTKYRIPGRTKDPFRHLIRDYCTMEQEKDNRQYGALGDVIARAGLPRQASRRWTEILKAVLPVTSFGEYAAMKSTGQLIDAIENSELRQGYLAQMIDENRHVSQEAYLARYLARHAYDTEGFARGYQLRSTNMFVRAGNAALETFFVGDPIEGALNLQVVTETAYTNPIFVAMTEVAAMNGDQATPTVFLSVQSDEARHMANGYATLAAVASEPDNLPHLAKDLDRAFWRQHAFLDPFLGVVYDYFQENRSTSYHEKWQEWVAEDWAGAYIARLAPFGVQAPRWFEHAAERVKWLGHTGAMFGFASWPMHFWRFDPLTDADMEWFERKYPGWYGLYGKFWESYRDMTDPACGALPLSLFESLPPLCRVCHMACIFPRPDISTARVKEHDGRKHAFCSQACEEIFTEAPHRYLAAPNFLEIYDGYGLDEYIREAGLLRADGRTLLGQPSLNEERMWTIDDIRPLGIQIRNPVSELPSQGEIAA